MPQVSPGSTSNPIDRNAVSADRTRRNWQRLIKGAANQLVTQAVKSVMNGAGLTLDPTTGILSFSGAGYDPAGAAAAAQAAAEAFSSIATNLTSGLVPTARLGTGTASSTTILYGDQTYKAAPAAPAITAVTQTNGLILTGSTLSFQNAVDAALTGQTGAITVCTTTPTGAGTFRVGGYLTITAISVDVLNLQIVWTDETSTTRTVSLFANGLSTVSLAATGVYLFSPVDVRVKANTSITLQVILTTGAGSVAYDVGGEIIQVRST